MATKSQWLLLTCLGFCTAWMDERPVLESRDGNLFISAAKDRNITLKILGDGYVNVNEINLLHVANAAESATRLIERWKTGYLAEVESDVRRLSQIIEGPEGLERRVAMMRAFGDGNNTTQLPVTFKNQTGTGVNIKIRMLVHRVRRVEDKVKSIEAKLKINECSSNPCLNGGTCQDLYDGYQCNCPSNWEGPNCMVDVNECVRLLGTDLGCQNGATCHNLPGSYRCDCTTGWFGLHCTKKTSICNTQNSEELCGHGVCVSKTGSPLGYTCICDQGWQADGTNPACIKDVDECAGNHRPCSVNPWVACRNAPGTFFCDSCPRGYTGNGYYCTDIDECQQDNGGCSTSPRVQCINTMGSRMCGPCPTGYRGDGVTCIYVGSCATNNGGCHPLATCVENPALTSAYVICRCPAGMVGDGIGPKGCQSSTDVSVSQPCSSNPCVHGRCVVTLDGHTCVCYSGYTGIDCSILMDPCNPNPCKNSGRCVISSGQPTCDCPSTHTGSRCETLRQTCGGVSRNPVGHLEFPIGGNVYQHGLSCAWVLITNSSLVLNVTFTRFNVEPSIDCKYDFLQIHDGRNAGSQMIGRFCNNTLPNGNGSIVSSHNSLYFWFHSDNSISHDGFAFHWNSIEPICGGTLSGDYGTISSPGSPGRYPPNRDCYWLINVKPTKRIQIHFGQLMLETHPNCEADFLRISTMHNEQLGLYCNHTRPPPLVVPVSEAVIYFHSDSAGQDAGFQIHYSAIEGIPGCNDVYTASSGTIHSPSNVENNADLECEWRIQMPVGQRVQIVWSNFELSQTCAIENVRVYDGATSTSPLLGRYCAGGIPPTVRSNSNVMLIVFASSWQHKGSFSLSYNVLCGGTFTEAGGIIQSPNYPEATRGSVTCIYEIKQPPTKRIVLNILDVNIFMPYMTSCVDNYLQIFDGPDENSEKIANLCGTAESANPLTYYSTHNVMFIKFSASRYRLQSQGRGFQANYTVIENRCGGLLTEPSGSIQTPTTNSYYHNNEECIWTMQAPAGHAVMIRWMSFDLETSIRCRHDKVEIFEKYTKSSKDSLGSFCGSSMPPTMVTQGNTMTVVFTSDSSITREGFMALYAFVDATKVCGGRYFKSTGTIKSPNYPKPYPNKKECVWVIEAPSKQKVILNITHFDLEQQSMCIFDYLEIRNGGYETSPLIGKYCGTSIPPEIISQTNQIYLRFVSDQTRDFPGFKLEWHTTEGCGGTMTAASGDIISPNYPQPYMQQADCNWKIAVAAGSLVRLVIVDLQLEAHEMCRFDYIEISEGIDRRKSQRYCTSPYPKVIESKSNMMNILFRSDFTNSERGFHLKYETLCQNKVQGFHGVIESPNFPDNYEHNLNCTWTINAPIGNKINISFSHFDLEGPRGEEGCKYDYLEIKEGEGNVPKRQLAKLCNTDRLPPKIHSTEHQVFVNFVTDTMLAFSGFRLEWLVDGCGGHLTRPFGSFTSPGYPSSYPMNVHCEWLIEVDHSHSIELTIHDINTEKQKSCVYDKLQIYSGENDEGLKLVEICHSPNPVVYTSFGNKMFLRFQSDISYAAKGFSASYRTIPITCGGRFTADTGVIFSTNYPQNYPSKMNCEWLLHVNANHVVNITFLDFDLEKTINCTDDYVQIYDGPTRDSPVLGKHCHNILPPSYVSTSNEMLVVMVSDYSATAKGFKAQYSKACGARIVVKDEGFLAPSESYTTDTASRSSCTWILVAEDLADHVTVTFTHMEIEVEPLFWGGDCSWNYVEVFEGEGFNGSSRGKWCANVVPLPITSNGNALTVHLVTNYDFIGHFALAYSALNSACGGTYTAYRGIIGSPGYPNTYPLNSECVWILNNSPGNKLTLTFSDFELQQSEHCNLDYLEIREDNGIGKLLGIFCGTSVESVETTKSIWMKFKSDGDDVGKGFKGEFAVTGGTELSGPVGRVTSPLYPIPYKRTDTTSWRITVEFGYVIRIELTDMFIEKSEDSCYSTLKVYDGYNDEAPVLLETCGLNVPDPVTTTSNVAQIELSTDIFRQGNYFDLNWIQIPRDTDNPYNGNSEIELSKCKEEVALMSLQNSTYDFSSPDYPNGYEPYLECTWLFTSPPGTHLVLRIIEMDLEETSGCAADHVDVYSGNALTTPNNAVLLEQLCLANATFTTMKADNVMTVKFISDGYENKTGFSAYVYRDCGGKLEGPNGVIEINNSTATRTLRTWMVRCQWTVEVRPGRTIEVRIAEMSIQQGPSFTCSTNFLMLKNGGETTSPLLGAGKYCGDVAPAPLQTTGNRLFVKASGVRANINFKLFYREVGMDCGGEIKLSMKQKQWNISSPNYPNIPPPFSECTWTVLAAGKERISIHFVDRFDLSNTLNCEKEYVEVRDGGTDSSSLVGRFCKDQPSSITSTGNMLFVKFYTDLPEPKNGFKAILSVGEVCGGIIRGISGSITSPNYPFFYPKNQTCTWKIVGPEDHTLKFSFVDIHLPGFRRCKNIDHVQISETNPVSRELSEIGNYCGTARLDDVETASNEATVKFISDNFEYQMYRGFSMNFSASLEVCGGELTALQGIIKSKGYPNIATRSRYCDWRIKLPKGFQVVVEILDLDIISMQEPRLAYSLSFYNDFRFASRIKLMSQNSTLEPIKSSSNFMMIGYYSSPGYRGFKLRYYAAAPAPCGGVITDVKGSLSAPKVPPFNQSSFFCHWSIEAPNSLTHNDSNDGIANTNMTLTIKVTGNVGGIRSVSRFNFCHNFQFIMITGIGSICGIFPEPVYYRIPKLDNELIIANGTYGKPMNFTLQYEWQPCGGMLKGLRHTVSTPKNISFPINCAWAVEYPDNGEMIRLQFNKLRLGGCDRNYISVKNGLSQSPEIAKFCGNVQPYVITSTTNRLWIEYTAAEEPNEFEFILEPANNGCGGALRGTSRELASPKFPAQYPNNAECTWEISTDPGFHIGLVFVDRFNLETSANCEKDYVQVFNWEKEANNSTEVWVELGKVCGRTTPPPFNSTGNRMKVIFHSNEAVQGDGFRAIWQQNCGGVFEVTGHTNVIVSPGYPNFYQPNLICNYTLVAPDEEIMISFTDFQLEPGLRDCRFDNLTIKHEDMYSPDESLWCGENKPPLLKFADKVEIIFKTDKYVQRNGFTFKYFLTACGGTITEPGVIKPLMNDNEYFGGIRCSWIIHAPADKSVVLRFEKFELETSHWCMYDGVEVYNGVENFSENRLAKLCGNLTGNLPVLKSNSSSMRVDFFADSSRHYGGFTALVLFVKSVEAGCGGKINVTEGSQTFKTQTGSTYDSLEDCHWEVIAAPGQNIKFTVNRMDLKNATSNNRTIANNECTGDYIEVRDGAGPFTELIGKYCGNQPPRPLISSINSLWIRFYSDGTLQGTGVTGTLESVDALCALAPPIEHEKSYVLTSPHYPENYEPGTRCRWLLEAPYMVTDKLKIHFVDFDMPESHSCENEYLQIVDASNRRYIEQGFGEDFVWNGERKRYSSFSMNDHEPVTSYKYCGRELPHEYYSYSTEVELTFKADSVGYRGFKLEYGSATCDRNYTAEQGRIVHEKIDNCRITITAPENHTISLYFNQFVFYDIDHCSATGFEVYDGDFDGTLMVSLCDTGLPSPIFTTGNKLSLHSWSRWQSTYDYYDITYTTTDAGRGCGGRIYNYAGSFSSPMYPNEYRNDTECTWDISVPRGKKLVLEFSVFDIGTKCSLTYNLLKIYDVSSTGEQILSTTYCGSDEPAPLEASSNRMVVKYFSSVNNVGTGWLATFKAKED